MPARDHNGTQSLVHMVIFFHLNAQSKCGEDPNLDASEILEFPGLGIPNDFLPSAEDGQVDLNP